MPSSSLYFGDAKSDYEAALSFNMDFVFISGFSDWENGVEFCQSNDIKILKDFSDFELEWQ